MSFLEIFCLTLLVEDLVIAGHEFESFDSIWVIALLRDYLVECWNDANEMTGSDDGTAEANGVLGRTRGVFIGRSGIRLHWGHAHPSACSLQPFLFVIRHCHRDFIMFMARSNNISIAPSIYTFFSF